MATYQVSTPDGRSYEVSADSDAQAQKAISSLLPSSNAPSEGAGMSFLRGVGNNIPLGPQFAALVSKGPYSANMAAQNQAVAQDKEQHPVPYGAGAVTGTLGPALIPGVGEAIAANPITTGALMGGTNAISNTDIQKQPLEALKQAATGTAEGALLGKLSSLIPVKGAQAAMEKKSSDIAVQSLNLPKQLLGNLSDEELTNYGKFAQSHDLLNPKTSISLANAHEALSQYGAEIGKSGAASVPVEDAGKYIQPLMGKMEQVQGLSAPGAAQDAQMYQRGAQDIVENGKTFQDLQNLKSYYGSKAFNANHEVVNQPAADIYGQIKQAMTDTVSNAPENYQKSLNNYTMAHDAVDGLKAKLGAERQGYVRSGIGMIGRVLGKMPGQSNPLINVPTAAAIGALGHPYMGMMAVTPTMTNPTVQSNIVTMAAKALPSIQTAVQQLVTRGMTNTQNQPDINNLIRQLKAKYDQRRNF